MQWQLLGVEQETQACDVPYMRSKLPPSTTAVHLAMSAAIRALNSSGVVGLGSLPSARSRSMTAGSLSTPVTSVLSRFKIAGGSPAGATSPCQALTRYPGTPDSATVGVSGTAKKR